MRYSEDEFLSTLSSLESKSEHPIAKAITKYVKEKNINPILITEFENRPGKGIKGKTDKNNLLAGNESFMLENKIDLNVVINELKNEAIKNSSLIFLAIDGDFERVCFCC